MQKSFRVPDMTLPVSNVWAYLSTVLLWVKPALSSRGFALTLDIRLDDRHENDFCVGSPTVFLEGLVAHRPQRTCFVLC